MTPPLPPLDRVQHVPTILASSRKASRRMTRSARPKSAVGSPPMSCWMTSYPSPKKAGIG